MANEFEIRVAYAHRSLGRFHSIEVLFRAVSENLPRWMVCGIFSAPRGRADLCSIVANLSWLRSLGNCDVIHQTGDIHYAILGEWRRPVILTIHDLRFIEEAKGIKRILFWWLWLYLPCLRANRVTVISEFTKQRLLALSRVEEGKVRVIPNCVAGEFAAIDRPWNPKTPCVLLVGTTPNKNLDRILQASVGLGVSLLILGHLGCDQRTSLDAGGYKYECHSDLSKEQVVELYQSCDLVCFVSTYEGFGMPILEGQAVGRPVMTSDIAPMNAVAGDGALLVDPFDVGAIRAGLVRILTEPDLRDELVRKGFENVKAYSAQSVASQYAALYREVLEDR